MLHGRLYPHIHIIYVHITNLELHTPDSVSLAIICPESYSRSAILHVVLAHSSDYKEGRTILFFSFFQELAKGREMSP